MPVPTYAFDYDRFTYVVDEEEQGLFCVFWFLSFIYGALGTHPFPRDTVDGVAMKHHCGFGILRKIVVSCPRGITFFFERSNGESLFMSQRTNHLLRTRDSG
jgi:hypothetical protein